MARKGRVDRGLVSKEDAVGKVTWWVRLYHGGKERRLGSFPNKTKAREFYEKRKMEQKEGRFFPERYQIGGHDLVEAMIAQYLPALMTKKTPEDEWFFAQWWSKWFKEQRLNTITPVSLEGARQYLLNRGLTPQRGNRYTAWLRKVLNLAVRDGKLASNPVTKVKAFKEPKGRTRFLTVDEEEKLMNALGPVYAPWARLAILTGLRQKEQFSLRWVDVDLKQGLITLPATKTGDVQYVPLSEDAKAILHDMDAKAAVAEAEAIAYEKKRSKWVFPSGNPETHIDPDNFMDKFREAVRQSGIDWVTWHELRHTFASRLAMSGANLSTIAALLRHSTTALVKRYAHLSSSYSKTAVDQVATFGKPKEEGQPSKSERVGEGQAFGGTVTKTGNAQVGETGIRV